MILYVLYIRDTTQGNVIFALPFVPGHAPLHVTDILGLIFVMVGLVVYRFGRQLSPIFSRIGAGGERAAKAAVSLRAGRRSNNNNNNGSGYYNNGSSSYALGEHRKPLLDLVEEGDEFLMDEDDEVEERMGGSINRAGGDRRAGRRGKDSVSKAAKNKVEETEWEM